jgi:spore photoproduct lyase
MVDTIYIEDDVCDHPRTIDICAHYPAATRVRIGHYGSVFNPRAQNFRLQKTNPSMILARKRNDLVLAVPDEYTTGGENHYYFSHMLNCVYDCRYCFLQGMFRSAHYLVFINFEDYATAIHDVAERHAGQETWFFSGYDCDSLALEPVTGFAEHFIPEFSRYPDAILELRTKSTQIRTLLKLDPLPNVVVAYSLNPDGVARALEQGAPVLERRIAAIERLQKHGWQIGLRFDPLIWHDDYQVTYERMFESIFCRIDADRIHSVTLGSFRLPNEFHKNMLRLYPDHWLFSTGLSRQGGSVSYNDEIQQEMLGFCSDKLADYMPRELVYEYSVSGVGGNA